MTWFSKPLTIHTWGDNRFYEPRLKLTFLRFQLVILAEVQKTTPSQIFDFLLKLHISKNESLFFVFKLSVLSTFKKNLKQIMEKSPISQSIKYQSRQNLIQNQALQDSLALKFADSRPSNSFSTNCQFKNPFLEKKHFFFIENSSFSHFRTQLEVSST